MNFLAHRAMAADRAKVILVSLFNGHRVLTIECKPSQLSGST